MKLIIAPRSRSIRARWILEEVNATYEIEHGADAPVLIDGDTTLTESSAICLYLADTFGLAPALDSPQRGAYLQWLLFAEVTLDPLILGDDPRLTRALDTVTAWLTGRQFVAGSSFTAADVVLSSVLHMAHARGRLDAHPALLEYTHRHTARLSSRRAVSR